MYYYHAFQLNICSDFLLPELLNGHQATPTDDILRISLGEVSPEGLEETLSKGLNYQANENALWLNVPDVARYLVTNGRQITVDPLTHSDAESIRLFLLGSCMGALLMQRNLFLLHGNAIKVGEHCISFAGHSGAGKSTLSGAFFKRGYDILADDVCAINDNAEVIPSFPQIKLWHDAAKHLAMETESLRKIRPSIEKFAVPLGMQFYTQALPLKIIYILHAHNKDDFCFDTISGMHKLQPLKINTYRQQYLKGLGKDRSHLKLYGNIANQTSVVTITRPNDGFKLDELVTLIEKDFQERGLTIA